MLGRLQLGGVRGQEAEADAVGDVELRAGVPAGVVEHQDDGLVRPGTDVAGEGVEHLLEQIDADAVGHPPLDLAGAWPDEAEEVEPLVSVGADCHRALAAPGPDPADQRLQPEPVLVEGPELDGAAGMLGLRRIHRLAEVFLYAARVSASAALACCGRGRCRV